MMIMRDHTFEFICVGSSRISIFSMFIRLFFSFLLIFFIFCTSLCFLFFFVFFFFFQAEDGIRDHCVTGVQTCALPIFSSWHAFTSCVAHHGNFGGRATAVASRPVGVVAWRCISVPPGGRRSSREIGRASCRERV